jgi:hypothetical protein
MHLNLSLFACVRFLVPHILAQNIHALVEICNLIDPNSTDTEGNDCHTDQLNELH